MVDIAVLTQENNTTFGSKIVGCGLEEPFVRQERSFFLVTFHSPKLC